MDDWQRTPANNIALVIVIALVIIGLIVLLVVLFNPKHDSSDNNNNNPDSNNNNNGNNVNSPNVVAPAFIPRSNLTRNRPVNQPIRPPQSNNFEAEFVFNNSLGDEFIIPPTNNNIVLLPENFSDTNEFNLDDTNEFNLDDSNLDFNTEHIEEIGDKPPKASIPIITDLSDKDCNETMGMSVGDSLSDPESLSSNFSSQTEKDASPPIKFNPKPKSKSKVQINNNLKPRFNKLN